MKHIVLLSGGLDSSTLLGEVERMSDYTDIKAISFFYGQRHSKELESAAKVAGHYGIDHTIFNLMDAFRPIEFLSFSSLLGNSEVPHGHYAQPSMVQTIVPNRNMIFISFGAAMAEAWLQNTGDITAKVWLAVHAGDHFVYPDCRPEFVEGARATVLAATESRVQVMAPFSEMTKTMITARGIQLDVPYGLTWSCYEGNAEPCGRCGTCCERIEAFDEINAVDPLHYRPEDLAYARKVIEDRL